MQVNEAQNLSSDAGQVSASRSGEAKPAKRSSLRLFVWTGFSPDYTSGLAFAIAKDETDARKQIVKAYGGDPYQWGTLAIHPLTRKAAYAVCGGG